jgi:hypothetical protein
MMLKKARKHWLPLAISLLLAVMLLSAIQVVVVLAAETTPDQPSDVTIQPLVKTLEFLAQGLGVGGVIAFLLEKPGWFKNLTSNAKWWLVLSLSVGLPLLAQVALQLVPAEVFAVVEPFWQAAAKGFVIWTFSQGIHLFQKRVDKAKALPA